MPRAGAAKATRKQRAVASIIGELHGNQSEPFEWLLLRFYALTKNIKPGSPSKRADAAMAMAWQLAPYMVARLRAVEVNVNAPGVVTLEIGGDEADHDFSAEYAKDEFSDINTIEGTAVEAPQGQSEVD